MRRLPRRVACALGITLRKRRNCESRWRSSCSIVYRRPEATIVARNVLQRIGDTARRTTRRFSPAATPRDACRAPVAAGMAVQRSCNGLVRDSAGRVRQTLAFGPEGESVKIGRSLFGLVWGAGAGDDQGATSATNPVHQ